MAKFNYGTWALPKLVYTKGAGVFFHYRCFLLDVRGKKDSQPLNTEFIESCLPPDVTFRPCLVTNDADPQKPKEPELLDDQTEKFVQHLTEHQQRIYGYIFSLVGDHNRAADILQETNLVLWRKHEEFRAGEPFAPWAFTIARFQVLANIRDRKRDRMLLDEGLIGLLADSAVEKALEVDQVRVALRSCMKRLTDKNLDLLKRRYFGGNSVRELSRILDRGESAIKVALMRTRHKLADCIKMEILKKNEGAVRKIL